MTSTRPAIFPAITTLTMNVIAPITYAIIAAAVIFLVIDLILAHSLNSFFVILVVPEYILSGITY